MIEYIRLVAGEEPTASAEKIHWVFTRKYTLKMPVFRDICSTTRTAEKALPGHVLAFLREGTCAVRFSDHFACGQINLLCTIWMRSIGAISREHMERSSIPARCLQCSKRNRTGSPLGTAFGKNSITKEMSETLHSQRSLNW